MGEILFKLTGSAARNGLAVTYLDIRIVGAAAEGFHAMDLEWMLKECLQVQPDANVKITAYDRTVKNVHPHWLPTIYWSSANSSLVLHNFVLGARITGEHSQKTAEDIVLRVLSPKAKKIVFHQSSISDPRRFDNMVLDGIQKSGCLEQLIIDDCHLWCSYRWKDVVETLARIPLKVFEVKELTYEVIHPQRLPIARYRIEQSVKLEGSGMSGKILRFARTLDQAQKICDDVVPAYMRLPYAGHGRFDETLHQYLPSEHIPMETFLRRDRKSTLERRRLDVLPTLGRRLVSKKKSDPRYQPVAEDTDSDEFEEIDYEELAAEVAELNA
jgi:hypothetical protein